MSLHSIISTGLPLLSDTDVLISDSLQLFLVLGVSGYTAFCQIKKTDVEIRKISIGHDGMILTFIIRYILPLIKNDLCRINMLLLMPMLFVSHFLYLLFD